MKILAIRGKNLASLEHSFEIDFTTEPLKSAGIFAITGSTGSGKSTLLDALCLALFDDAPRTSHASENIPIQDVGDKTLNQRDCRTILRRGASEGYAEVDFISLSGEKFRSRWSVRRARNKIDGSMQDAEIQLSNLTTNNEEQGRKTELLARIVSLIGLTFDQFTRSVLLAQGDFATFLKAKQSEKAELLEKLTGTDIYSRISKTIFDKTKEAEAALTLIEQRIQNIALLPDEKINAYEAEKKSITEQLETLKKENEQIANRRKWIEENMRLTNDLEQAKKNLSIAIESIESAKNRFKYIAQINSVQDIRDSFTQLKNTKKVLSENQNKLNEYTQKVNDNTKALTEAETTYKNKEQEQRQLLDKQKEIMPQIIRARELDVLISEAEKNLNEAQKDFETATKIKEKTEKEIRELQQSIKKDEQNFASANQWLTERKHLEKIVSRTDLLTSLATDAQTAREQREINEKILESNKIVLDSANKKLEQLKQEAERLNKIMPAEIAVLRAQLTEGVPCPVCGSIHHPAANIKVVQRMKEQELSNAKTDNAKQIDTVTNEIENRKNEISKLSALIESYATQEKKAYQKLESDLSCIPDWKNLFEETTLKEFLNNLKIQWDKKTETLNNTKDSLNILQTNLKNGTDKLDEVGKDANERNVKLVNNKNILKQLQSERTTVLHGKPADSAEKYFADNQKIKEEELKRATDEKNKLVAEQKSLNDTISQIKIDIAKKDEEASNLQNIVYNWTTLNNISFDRLSELLTKDNAWIQTETKALKSLTEAETTAKATLAERQKNIDTHNQSEAKPTNANETQESLQNAQQEKKISIDNIDKRVTEIKVALIANEKNKELIRGLEKDLNEKRSFANNWQKLNSLLGSASGDKFKKIAQCYTLETLLGFANKHLQELAPRYKLQRISDSLALQVVDLDMLNEVRTVHTLSGGESFLISLALALGLSSLSSNRMKVESLFIDEGFGSLDNDTLRIAMDALEHLQTQGRKIGIISHVTEMTERIAVQIKVTKTANGKSEVTVCGN